MNECSYGGRSSYGLDAAAWEDETMILVILRPILPQAWKVPSMVKGLRGQSTAVASRIPRYRRRAGGVLIGLTKLAEHASSEGPRSSKTP